MVAAKAPEAAPKPIYSIDPRRASDPQAYVDAHADVLKAAGEGRIPAIDATRHQQLIADNCMAKTSIALEDATREQMAPLLRFKGLLKTSAEDLKAVRKAVIGIDEIEMDEDEKKKAVALIDEAIALQKECRDHPAKSWVYIGRDSEDGTVFRMSPVHIRFFRVWNNPDYQNSMVMAPPGHGKTTCLRGQVIWEVGQDPKLRCLLIYDQDGKAKKEVLTIKKLMRSDRFRALFPEVVVLGRGESEEDSNRRFTVSRKNWMSREPTIEGAAITSQINGNRYDRLYGDDFNPPDVRHHAAVRRNRNERWISVVEERMSNPAKIRMRIICTPWHEEDTSGIIAREVRKGNLKNWLLGIDEFAIKDDASGMAIPIWGERFNSDYFEDKKDRLGALYTLNYRLMPREDKERTITRLCYYDSKDTAFAEKLATGEWFLSIDPSATSGVGSSDTGAIEAVISPGGYGFFTDVWFHHKSPTDMLGWIVDRIIKKAEGGAPYKTLFMEAQGGIKGMVNMWLQMIPEMLTERGYTHELDIQTPGTRIPGSVRNIGKTKRLIEAAPYFDNGIIRIAGELHTKGYGFKPTYRAIPGSRMEIYRDHMLNFDGTHNTDAVDAGTQFVLLNRDNIKNPNVRKKVSGAQVQAKALSPMVLSLQRQIEELSKPKEKSGYAEEETYWQERVA